MFKKVTYAIVSFIAGFIGGSLSPWVFCWIKSVSVEEPDAVSIANTYIVFTTIIFVAATVILTIMGYVFTHQFSNSKKKQVEELFDQLKEDFKANGEKSVLLVTEIMKNPDVVRHVQAVLAERISMDNLELDATENDDRKRNIIKGSLR